MKMRLNRILFVASGVSMLAIASGCSLDGGWWPWAAGAGLLALTLGT